MSQCRLSSGVVLRFSTFPRSSRATEISQWRLSSGRGLRLSTPPKSSLSDRKVATEAVKRAALGRGYEHERQYRRLHPDKPARFACSVCPRKGAKCEVPFENDIVVAALAGEDGSMSTSPGAYTRTCRPCSLAPTARARAPSASSRFGRDIAVAALAGEDVSMSASPDAHTRTSRPCSSAPTARARAQSARESHRSGDACERGREH
jgi:hypothetical protein